MSAKVRKSSAVVADHRFLLLGKTGCGKSTTGNTILGGSQFDSAFSFESVTSKCSLQRSKRNGEVIEIMDSPGLFDTTKNHEEVSRIVMQAVACMHPGPDAVLYVIKLGRYTEEEFGVYNRLKALFDEHVTDHMILLFTHGDSLKGASFETLLNKVPAHLKQVLAECGYRYVVFDNTAPNKQEQVNELLSKVAKIRAANENRPYECPKYSELGEKMEAEIERRMTEVEKREVERKKFVQQLNSQLDETKQKAEEERAAFEKKEKERDEQMKAQQGQMEQEMKNLNEMLQQQKVSEAEQKAQMQALKDQQEQQKKQLEAEREAERKRNQEQMQQMEQSAARLKEEMEREKQRLFEEQQREVSKLKDEIARSNTRRGGCAIL